MRFLLLVLRWQIRQVMKLAAATDDQLAYPALVGVEKRLTWLLARQAKRCRHHVHGCPRTCDLRELTP